MARERPHGWTRTIAGRAFAQESNAEPRKSPGALFDQERDHMIPQQFQRMAGGAGGTSPGGSGPLPPGMTAPVSFWEWFMGVYDPNEFVYNTQWYGVAITAAANTAQNVGNLNIQVPLFVFGVRSYGWVTASGSAPAYVYGVGIQHASGNDWTFGQWASPIVTGSGGGVAPVDVPFLWPREVAPSTQLTVTINNTLYTGSAALTVHAAVVGLEPRPRANKLAPRRY